MWRESGSVKLNYYSRYLLKNLRFLVSFFQATVGTFIDSFDMTRPIHLSTLGSALIIQH